MLRIRILLLSSLVAFVSLSAPVFAQGNLERDVNACLSSQDADQIVASCTRLLQSGRYPENRANMYLNRGVGYRRRGDLDRAIADQSEAIRINPSLYAAYINRGDTYHQKKNYEQALADFEIAIQLKPRDAKAYFLAAKAARGLNDRYRTIVNLNEAISLNPNYAEAYYWRGVYYDETGEKIPAIKDFQKAAALGDKFAADELKQMGVGDSPTQDLGKIAQLLTDFEKHCTNMDLSNEAIVQNCSIFIDKGLLKGSYLAEAYNTRGVAYERQGRAHLAQLDYQRSMELNPDQSSAYHNYAGLLTKDGNLQLALKYFDEAIARGATDAGTHTRRGAVLLQLARYSDAIQAFDAIIRDDPQHFGAHYLRGVARKRIGDSAGGDEDIRKSRMLGEANRRVYDLVIRDFEARGLKP